MKDLTHGKPARIILYFALPILIGNLFNLAYNLADTRIVGTYLGNDALAAVGSISTLNDLLVGFIVGLANGFAVIMAQHFGSGDKNKSRKVFALSILMGLVVTAIVVAGKSYFYGWTSGLDECDGRAQGGVCCIYHGYHSGTVLFDYIQCACRKSKSHR